MLLPRNSVAVYEGFHKFEDVLFAVHGPIAQYKHTLKA